MGRETESMDMLFWFKFIFTNRPLGEYTTLEKNWGGSLKMYPYPHGNAMPPYDQQNLIDLM